jgi:hypothetical protein
MSEQTTSWSQSQKDAFAFVRRSVGEGLSARAGLSLYRSGGGHIGNEYWFSLYKTQFNIEGWKDTIQAIPPTYNINKDMFTDVDMDFREEYVLQAKVTGYSADLGQNVTKWVTVESDHIMTKQEWLWGMQQAVDSSIGSPNFIIESRSEYTAMHRARGM